MWISAAVVILTTLVLLQPVEEVGAEHSRLVIHTPQQVKVIHRYHTSEHYAKDYGYGGDYHKPKKPRRSKGHRSHKGRGRRGRYRKRYIRKVGRRTHFTGGKSYGMFNYAKNYRNWTPQRRPRSRYRDSYMPIHNSQEDDGYHADSEYHDVEDSSNESRPFENEIHTIDSYAQRNRNYNRRGHSRSSNPNGASDYINRNSYQSDTVPSESHVHGYSTLPDEFINTHSSSGHSSAAGQEFRFKNQNFGSGQQTDYNVPTLPEEFINTQSSSGHSSTAGQGFRFKNQNFGSGQQSDYNVQNSPLEQETRFSNNKFWSSDGQDSRLRSQSFEVGHELQLTTQKPRGGHEPRSNNQHLGGGQSFSSQNFGVGHESQYNIKNPHIGQESRFNSHNFGGGQDLRYNTQNSAGRYNNQSPESGSGGVRYDGADGFSTSHGNSDTKRPYRETGGANPDDLYYKAFRAFSFRKNPTDSGSKEAQLDSFSGGGFNAKGISLSSSPTHQAGIAHRDRQNNQWVNQGPNKDHDIGFFEGLEDLNDEAGI